MLCYDRITSRSTIWFFPRFAKEVPFGQHFLINLLFVGCVICGYSWCSIWHSQLSWTEGVMPYYFGSQTWKLMELGRIFRNLLFTGFVLWIFILFQGMLPFLNMKTIWSTHAWLFYRSLVMVCFLFFSLKLAPKANFVVADCWRWMSICGSKAPSRYSSGRIFSAK
eukprot:87338_1